MKDLILRNISDFEASYGDVVIQERVNRRERLNALIEQHGYENTSLAAGLSVATLSQYLRSKAPLVSEKAVLRAEYVLRNV